MKKMGKIKKPYQTNDRAFKISNCQLKFNTFSERLVIKTGFFIVLLQPVSFSF